MQVFLGFANFYRRFINGFSRVARPLTQLLVGGKAGKFKGPFTLTPQALAAFEGLKKAFTTAPVLVHYDPDALIRIETDASGFGISGILSQPRDDVAAATESKKATKAENAGPGAQQQRHWHPVAF